MEITREKVMEYIKSLEAGRVKAEIDFHRQIGAISFCEHLLKSVDEEAAKKDALKK